MTSGVLLILVKKIETKCSTKCFEVSNNMANSDTYKTFGRHTQTGKLLYNIYNAHQRNTYKPNVKLILNKENTDPHEEHLTKLRKERQILKDRKNTPISDPSLPKQPTKVAKIFSMRGRKPKNLIENELEDIEKETSQLPISKRMYIFV